MGDTKWLMVLVAAIVVVAAAVLLIGSEPAPSPVVDAVGPVAEGSGPDGVALERARRTVQDVAFAVNKNGVSPAEVAVYAGATVPVELIAEDGAYQLSVASLSLSASEGVARDTMVFASPGRYPVSVRGAGVSFSATIEVLE